MKYRDGREVLMGDVVGLGADKGGVVVCLIDSGEYSDDYPEAQWSYLKNGMVVAFPSYGTIHYEEPEEDLELIARANVESKKT